jgi:alpha-tubulin suppressor-like RCC1 family protein
MHNFLKFLISIIAVIFFYACDNNSPSAPDLNSEPNSPPDVSAGADRSVEEQSHVILTGTATDEDGTIAIVNWVQTDGPSVVLSNANALQAEFDAPSLSTQATLIFEISAQDNVGATASDSVSITVNPVSTLNEIPIANAGSDQIVAGGVQVSLNGFASSDDDGTISAYLWTQIAGPSVDLTNATSDIAIFSAPSVSNATTLQFELKVTDNENAFSTDTVTITITPPNNTNLRPSANAGNDQEVFSNATVTLNGGQSNDTDGTITTYQWSQLSGPSVTLVDSTAAMTTFGAPLVTQSAILVFELSVTDNSNETGTDIVNITVHPIPSNINPIARAGADQYVLSDDAVTLNGSLSSDEDGSITSYNWTQLSGPGVTLINANTASTGFTAPSVTQETILEFQLQVTDNDGATNTDTVIVTVTLPSALPEAVPGVSKRVRSGQTVMLDGSASTGTITSYNWVQTIGPNITLSYNPDNSIATFTAPTVDETVTLRFRLTVTDSYANVDISYVSVWIVPALNTTGIWQIDAASATACALGEMDIVCWGTNFLGENPAPPLQNPAHLSLGNGHICVLDDTGVVCWGQNEYGETDIPELSNPTYVSAGADHTCALDDNGLTCWGRNDDRQTDVPALQNPTLVSAGIYHTCALDDTGVVCWGFNNIGQSTPPALNNPSYIAAGWLNSCALDDSGAVCWGMGVNDQLAVPSLTNPTSITTTQNHICAVDQNGVKCWGISPTEIANEPTLINPTQVASGSGIACALDETGVVCWATYATDEVITVPPLSSPTQITTASSFSCAIDNTNVECWGMSKSYLNRIPTLSNPIQIDAGTDHICALDDDGVKCWGGNIFGESTVPATLVNPTQISAGGYNTCVIDSNEVVCWGYDAYDQNTVPALSNPVQVSVGTHFICALDDNGVVCWGDNTFGQTAVPTLINPTLINAGGYGHACALDDTGVVCWGRNQYGESTVPALLNPRLVSIGDFHTCALDDTGVVCWGSNGYGQSDSILLNNPTQLEASQWHNCVLDSNGVSCWGIGSNTPDFVRVE